MNKIFGVLLLAVFVVACAGTLPVSEATPTHIAMPTPTLAHPTITLSPTTRPTLAPTPTPKPKPTQEPLKTGEHRAPNGWWSAQGWGEFRGETYHAELRVTRADGQVSWVASQDWNAGLGVPVPTPLEWSQDGRYLYYTNVPLVDGYVCSIPVNGSDLWRMDLTDGSATQLVPEVGLAVSLSPNEKTFAYVSFGPQQDLVLRDLATGEERRAPLPADTQAGGIVWSLDSSVMMLTVAEKPCSGEEATSILKVDVETLTMQAVLTDGSSTLQTLVWENYGWVLLSDGKWLDPITGQPQSYGPWRTTTSPNHEWIAMVMERISEEVELEVIRGNGSQAWAVKEKIQNEGGFWPLGWSLDSTRLYFTLQIGGDGCGGASNGTDLRQLNLESGLVTQIISTTRQSFLALSPDTQTLAYKDNYDLVLHNLTSGIEQRSRIEAIDEDNYGLFA